MYERGFGRYIFENGLNKDDVIDLFQITSRTYSNWSKYGAPHLVKERLSLITGHHPDWQGFKILDGQIRCPNGDLVNKHQIESHYWYVGNLSLQSKRCDQVERLNNSLMRRIMRVGGSTKGLYGEVAMETYKK